MRTIAIVNQKGGVGKTTTTANLGAGLSRRGKRVLLVDLDAQAHLTFHLGVDNTDTAVATAYELMTARASLDETIVRRGGGLDVIASHIDLAGAEVELVSTLARERILRDALAPCEDHYDFVLIDCPPSLGLMTLNALVAADDILLTLQPHVLALQGMSKLLETADMVRDRLNPDLRISGVVFCMFDGRTTLSSEVLADVEGFFDRAASGSPILDGVRVLETRVRRNIKLAEAPGFGQTIFEYAPTSHGAEDYDLLTDELLNEPTAPADLAADARSEAPAQSEPDQPAAPPPAQSEPGAPPASADTDSPEAPSPSEEPPHDAPADAENPPEAGAGAEGERPAADITRETPATTTPQPPEPPEEPRDVPPDA